MAKALEEYRQFALSAEHQKAVNTLKGLTVGLRANGSVSAEEARELLAWCSAHEALANRAPFKELVPLVQAALADGEISEEEQANIQWLCQHTSSFVEFYGDLAGSIQYLNGLVHGMLADRELSDDEIRMLHNWILDNDFLAGSYPFDELNSMVSAVLADGVITEEERGTLMAFMGSLVDFNASQNLKEADFSNLREKYSIGGICSICPEIEFEGRTFVVTGEFAQKPRAEAEKLIEELGGKVKTAVSKKTDYLIVGNAGNPCWAFSCYGRKIEAAMLLRREGEKVQIVNETDFWDAIEDLR